MNRIQNGQTERFIVTALDESGDFVTGLSDVLLEIQRTSDNYYLDFDDNTFKVSGWTTRQETMTELYYSYSPGSYYYDFDTTGFSDDEYYLRATSATAENSPYEGYLKVGGFVDNIDTAISSIDTKIDLITTETDKIKYILGLSQENYRIFSPAYDSNDLLTSGTVKIYSTATDCNNDTNALATYTITATYSGTNMLTYKVIKA